MKRILRFLRYIENENIIFDEKVDEFPHIESHKHMLFNGNVYYVESTLMETSTESSVEALAFNLVVKLIKSNPL